MAKGNTGGKLASSTTISSTATIPNATTVAANATNAANSTVSNATPAPGSGIANFMNMTDQQKADAISQALKTKSFKINGDDAPDTTFQKLAHNLGIDGLPNLVTDTDLDKVKGADIFRAFSSSTQDGADAITANVMMDNETFYSDTGGSAYGRGIYFMGESKNSNESFVLSKDVRIYGSGSHSNIIRAKLNDNAKTISIDNVDTLLRKEINSGSALGKKLNTLDRADGRSIMAISKGYNVITDSSGFSTGVTVVLDRSAISMSYTYHRVTANDRSKANSGSLKWKDMEK